MAKNIGHLIVIGVLIVVFFTLLIFSTSNKNIISNYTLVDEVEINSFSKLDVIKIGSATIENNGLLSSRVDLKRYVVCQISDNYGDSFYEVQYRGASTLQGNDVFSYNYYQKRLDISSKEKVELDITINPYSISKYNVEQEGLYNSTLPFYLYEITDNTDVWSYCNTVKIEDASKVIYVKLNIPNDSSLDVPAIPRAIKQ